MKTLTLTVSDEFAKNLETLRDIFTPEDQDAGRALDALTGWHLKNLIADDADNLKEEVDRWTFATIKEAKAAGRKISALLGEEAPYTWAFKSDRKSGPFTLVPLQKKEHEEIWDACSAREIDYDDAKYMVGARMRESGLSAIDALDQLLDEQRKRKGSAQLATA